MLLLIGIDDFVIELRRVMDGWGGGAAATVALAMTVTTKTYWYLWC